MPTTRSEYFLRREAEERAKATICAPEVQSVHVAMADLYASQARTARALSAQMPWNAETPSVSPNCSRDD